ncbi:guanitoxin biosynthesis heme-dependent pre-guanitoxin N-hydroxylase GntA [Lentzea sp. CA-135723]|uniref:guanitoxin biosynthesis heme-dependent pre-guanitoxin N-hydroxylase GntA n=1 Tax=Lentzea sp. CA-135723 TaxID=3239950 RepID=UPI003D916D68
MATELEESFRDWLTSDSFACLGARASLRRGELTVRSYGPMGSLDHTRELHEDLVEFLDFDADPEAGGFHSFAALFTDTETWTEQDFEKRLWQQVQDLHGVDRLGFAWADEVSMDPAAADFGFSVGEHPVFVVGIHPGASRVSRRFGTPGLVFNSHRQFTALKKTGVYQGLQKAIRRRDVAIQGVVNPMLGDFGERSEACQYSGREVPADWDCPFHPFP